MQRNVPQFIEIEDKIFGPFTLKQFAYLAGGVGLSVIIWRSFPLSFGIFLISPIMGLSIALAFMKYNSKPFIDVMRAAIYFIFSKKLFLWQNPSNKESIKRRDAQNIENKKVEESFNRQNLSNKSFSRNEIADLANRLNNK